MPDRRKQGGGARDTHSPRVPDRSRPVVSPGAVSEIFAICGHDISEISDVSDGKSEQQRQGFKVMPTVATPPEIGARVRETRRDKGLTLQRLAELTGKRASLLSELERGKHFPDLRTLMPVACALDVSVDWLITGRENGKP